MILHELYIGNENKNLKTIRTGFEKIGVILKKEYNEPHLSSYTNKEKADIKKTLAEMQKAMISEFNFDPATSFELRFTDSFVYETITSYCYDILNYDFTSDKKVTDFISIDGGRYKFKKNNMCYANIAFSTGIYNLLSYEEMMACCLHEIGHSFQVPLRVFNYRIAAMNTLKKYIGKVDSEYDPKATPGFIKVMADFMKAYNDRNQFLIWNNKMNETFADQFAASYGYSRELASALVKLEHENNRFISRRGDDLLDSVDAMLTFVLGADHPSNIERIQHSIIYMKKLSEDPTIPKKYRDDIKRKIVDMDRLAKEALKSEQGDSIFVACKKALALLTYKEPDEITEDDWNDITINQMNNLDYIGKKVL